MANPFDQNQPVPQPDYSPGAEIARNEVWQALPPTIPDFGFMRNHPSGSEVSQHQDITIAFAPLGVGTQYMGLNTDRLVVATWQRGFPIAWALAMAPAQWSFNIEKLLTDIAGKNTTSDLPYFTYALWEGVLNGATDIVTLRDADRGTSVWFHAADMAGVMAAGGKAYDNIVANIKAELAKSPVGA